MENTVLPIVIVNRNKIRKKKKIENPSKRALLSTFTNGTNSPNYEVKKSLFFISPNCFQALATDEQDNVFVTNEAQIVTKPGETSPKHGNVKLPNIVLTNVTDFSTLNKDLINIVDPEGFTCKAIRSNIIYDQTHGSTSWLLSHI